MAQVTSGDRPYRHRRRRGLWGGVGVGEVLDDPVRKTVHVDGPESDQEGGLRGVGPGESEKGDVHDKEDGPYDKERDTVDHFRGPWVSVTRCLERDSGRLRDHGTYGDGVPLSILGC